MRKKILVFIGLLALSLNAFAFDIAKLANNKEVVSKYLTNDHLSKIDSWLSLQGDKQQVIARSKRVLSRAIKLLNKNHSRCDLNLDLLLSSGASDEGLALSKSDYLVFMAFLRSENVIDDILFRILNESHHLSGQLENAGGRWPLRPLNTINDVNRGVEIEKMYLNLKTYPNELGSCSIDAYRKIAWSFSWKNQAARDRQLKRFDYLALNSGAITLETYNRLEVLRESGALDWPVYINRYLDVIENSKDKLAVSASSASPFATKYSERKSKITHRTRLYRNFNSTQVMILSDIIHKQAKRMDARHVSITWRYTDDEDSETDIYVLSPMERYRLSIKMLRKDMAEAMRSDLFKGTSIEYEDLVAAAYETGLVKSDELEHVLKFEEFWDPKVEKWKSYANFAFQIAGSASFFLPPPWNVVGALALVLTQTAVMNGRPEADSDDNWNVII